MFCTSNKSLHHWNASLAHLTSCCMPLLLKSKLLKAVNICFVKRNCRLCELRFGYTYKRIHQMLIRVDSEYKKCKVIIPLQNHDHDTTYYHLWQISVRIWYSGAGAWEHCLATVLVQSSGEAPLDLATPQEPLFVAPFSFYIISPSIHPTTPPSLTTRPRPSFLRCISMTNVFIVRHFQKRARKGIQANFNIGMPCNWIRNLDHHWSFEVSNSKTHPFYTRWWGLM